MDAADHDRNNARRALALIVEHGVDIYVHVAPLRPALEVAAASDPDINAYWRAVAERAKAACAPSSSVWLNCVHSSLG